jgi:hypothetical protein
VIYNLGQFIKNLTVVNADWKAIWYNAVKRNWAITYYFTSVLIPCNEKKGMVYRALDEYKQYKIATFFCFLMTILG